MYTSLEELQNCCDYVKKEELFTSFIFVKTVQKGLREIKKQNVFELLSTTTRMQSMNIIVNNKGIHRIQDGSPAEADLDLLIVQLIHKNFFLGMAFGNQQIDFNGTLT